ncbi:ATP-binding response regulator [Natronobiforma cellulositropha]|uniref:ATP-binding response regulator n=1 Tax=Natronobiforma cellulositropha TaxID=1679076 RepID=UPI0021D5B360|nr:ATP-binding protein [Natronobiforma cellulositropha]
MSGAGERDIDLLIVEDNADDARYVSRLIHESATNDGGEGGDGLLEITSIDHVDRLGDALEYVRTHAPDVILLDLQLPDSSGLETVETMVASTPAVPVVVLTGQNDTDVGVEAIQRGAQDYLVKGTITAALLRRTLRYAIERKRNQRELVDRNHRLALLNQIVRQDIRNDVSMIVGWGDQLRTQVDADGETALEALLEATQHVVDLTDTAAEVMDVIAADSSTPAVTAGPDGGAGVAVEPCDLTDLLETEVARLRAEHTVDLTLECEREGGAGEALSVAGSPMLASVFRHLLSNAIRHNDNDRPTITVTVEADDASASVTVTDDGVGIPDRQKALLVDPERRFDGRSGMGVGLYLVTTVLEEIGGRIDIENNYPQGTAVTVTLERVGKR